MNKRILISGLLLAIGVAAGLHFESASQSGSGPSKAPNLPPLSTKAVNADSVEVAPDAILSTAPVPMTSLGAQQTQGTPPVRSQAENSVLAFIQVMDRYRRGDDTLTGAEIQAAEDSAAYAIEHSPEARRLFAQQLSNAFRASDTISMFSLERSFMHSEAGSEALISVYDSVVSRGDSLSNYAIQGLNQLRHHMTEGQQVRYLEMAIRHFNSNQSVNEYLPAMMYMVDASAELQGRVPIHSDIALRLIQSRQAIAQAEVEQFHTSRSLYRLLPGHQRLDLANRMLATQPTPGNIQAVLDALQNNAFPLDSNLRSVLYSSISRTRLNPEQLALAEAVLGLTPSTAQARGG